MVRLSLVLASVFAAIAAANATTTRSVAPESQGAPRTTNSPYVGCTAQATKALVREFAASYSRGRVAAINAIWASAPYFQWFSTNAPGRRLGSNAYDRRTLAAYFRARARLHERIDVTVLRARLDTQRNIVNFSGTLMRTADDLPSPSPHEFKGAASCLSKGPLLIVWSM